MCFLLLFVVLSVFHLTIVQYVLLRSRAYAYPFRIFNKLCFLALRLDLLYDIKNKIFANVIEPKNLN